MKTTFALNTMTVKQKSKITHKNSIQQSRFNKRPTIAIVKNNAGFIKHATVSSLL